MSLDEHRKRALVGADRMQQLGRYYRETVAVEARTLLALLDVAEAAHRAMHGPARDTRPTDDLADALDRLREVTA
jgi:hypothetical protein